MRHISLIVKLSFFSLLIFSVIISNKNVQAHPGRTDSSGCHTCRTNCSSWGLSSGEYHCHNTKISAPQPKEPIKSVYGEDGTGYTKPAPEYKTPKENIDNIKDSNLSSSTTDMDSNYTTAIVKDSNDLDSSLGTFVILSLIGGTGYFLGKKKSSE